MESLQNALHGLFVVKAPCALRPDAPRPAPVAEGLEKPPLSLAADHLGRELAIGLNRLPHLRDVFLAVRAFSQVRFEPRALRLGQNALHVVGHELDELLAGHLIGFAARHPGARSDRRAWRYAGRCNAVGTK